MDSDFHEKKEGWFSETIEFASRDESKRLASFQIFGQSQF